MGRALSLAALTVLELDPAARVRCAAEAGYSHVSLRLIAATPDEPQHDLLHEGPARRALLQALADTALPVLDVEILRLEPHTRVAGFEPVLAMAERVGTPHLLVAGNDPEPARLLQHYGQLCDVPAAVPPTLDAIRTEARTARRFPGEGGLDLLALLRALPADLPISLEAPTGPPALAGPALQRAQRALAGAHAVLQAAG